MRLGNTGGFLAKSSLECSMDGFGQRWKVKFKRVIENVEVVSSVGTE